MKPRFPFATRYVLSGLCCFLMLAILTVVYLVDRSKTLYHFATVDPGKLYRSGTLSLRGLEKTHAMVGFKTIINLRTPAEMKVGTWYAREQQFAAEHGISLVDLPMLPDVPPDADQMRRFLEITTDPARLPALVHCEMGVIRTGMMVAIYKVAVLKESARKVLDDLPMFGHRLDDHPAAKAFLVNLSPRTMPSLPPVRTGPQNP